MMSAVANSVFTSLEPRVIEKIVRGHLYDVFAVLGPHRVSDDVVELRTFQPGAASVSVIAANGTLMLEQIEHTGLFVGNVHALLGDSTSAKQYKLQVTWHNNGSDLTQEFEDPYAFGLLLGELDLHLIAEGRHRELGRCLGALPMTIDGVEGTRFAVWAPNAQTRFGGRRLQHVGRPSASDAAASASRRMGIVHSARRRRYTLQVRTAGQQRSPAAAERPTRLHARANCRRRPARSLHRSRRSAGATMPG
jgi:hypothetical protein